MDGLLSISQYLVTPGRGSPSKLSESPGMKGPVCGKDLTNAALPGDFFDFFGCYH